MKRLVDFYLKHQNYAENRKWENWPFHKFYNYFRERNGGKSCVEKWREIIETNWNSLNAEMDFDALYTILEKYAASVSGIGVLHVYDTATCFLHPTKVYLHSGPKVAANAIPGITSKVEPASTFVRYNSELARLTPLQLEDFLCINKDVFTGKVSPEVQLEKHKSRHQNKCQGFSGWCKCN